MKLKRLLSFSLACFICLCVLLATDRRAYAYVDPGQGLLVLQSLASALAALGYFMRRRIRALFGGSKQDAALEIPAVKAPLAAEEGKSRKAA